MRLRVAAVIVAVACVGQSAHADFLGGFIGNTNMGPNAGAPADVDGTVSFAVLSLADPEGLVDGIDSPLEMVPFFTPGLGSGPMVPAPYLYLYQVSNNGAELGDINSVAITIATGSAVSWGFFGVPTPGPGPGLTFADGAGLVDYGNAFGSDTGVPAGPFVADAPAEIGVAAPAIVPSTVPAPYTSTLPLFSIVGGGAFQTLFFTPALTQTIAGGDSSVIIGFQSFAPPVLGSASLQTGGATASGDVPSTFSFDPVVPEVHNYLSVLAMACVGLVFGFRRWYKQG
jgi:hypothetical protein